MSDRKHKLIKALHKRPNRLDPRLEANIVELEGAVDLPRPIMTGPLEWRMYRIRAAATEACRKALTGRLH